MKIILKAKRQGREKRDWEKIGCRKCGTQSKVSMGETQVTTQTCVCLRACLLAGSQHAEHSKTPTQGLWCCMWLSQVAASPWYQTLISVWKEGVLSISVQLLREETVLKTGEHVTHSLWVKQWLWGHQTCLHSNCLALTEDDIIIVDILKLPMQFPLSNTFPLHSLSFTSSF